jgi:hypothetical protein
MHKAHTIAEPRNPISQRHTFLYSEVPWRQFGSWQNNLKSGPQTTFRPTLTITMYSAL